MAKKAGKPTGKTLKSTKKKVKSIKKSSPPIRKSVSKRASTAPGEATGAAGALDVSEGAAMLDKGGDIRSMAAAVSAMSKEDLNRGLELARMAGELWTAGDLADVMKMPVLSQLLESRGMRLQEIAVEVLLRFTGTRVLAQAIQETGAAVEEMGREEIAEGLVRMAASEAMAERSAELAKASDSPVR